MMENNPTVVSDTEQGDVDGEAATSVVTDSFWMRRHLSGSIYIWACGENADDKDEDPKLSDRLIGWLILIMQGFAYAMLIVLARRSQSSDTDSSASGNEEPSNLLPSVTGAMYLLVASTSHDLRAGYSLLVDGSCTGHRSFGIGLLVVYGIMISAAMKVLVSTSESSASVVLNAVTVTFIADLDEKALKLLLTVPQKWRLFWALESIGISFALALVAIIYVEDSSPQMEGSDGPHPYGFTTWFVFWFNPASVTLVALLLSSTLQGLCDLWDEARERVEEPTFMLVVKSTCGAIVAALKRGKERLRQEPCFYGTLGVWLAQVVPDLFNIEGVGGVETAVRFVEDTPTSIEGSFEITSHKHHLICLTAVLTSGLALKAITLVARRYSASRCSLEGGEPIDRWTDGKVSRVPNLLVGWGIGYWMLSLLFVLGCSLHGGGWNNAPGIVTFLAYIIVPGFLISGAFMVADINFLGKRFGAFFKPAGDILNDRYRVEYWVMVTVFRDFIVVWIVYCRVMGSMLSYW